MLQVHVGIGNDSRLLLHSALAQYLYDWPSYNNFGVCQGCLAVVLVLNVVDSKSVPVCVCTTCRCTFCDYFLSVSLKSTHLVIRYFANTSVKLTITSCLLRHYNIANNFFKFNFLVKFEMIFHFQSSIRKDVKNTSVVEEL